MGEQRLPAASAGLPPVSPPAAWLRLSAIVAMLPLVGSAFAAPPLWVGRFDGSAGGLPAGWTVEHLNPRFTATEYRQRLWDGVAAVEATAVRSMALLVRPLEVDLEITPVLCWRWRIDAPLLTADLDSKAGDDYAARVYLSFSVPPASLGLATRSKLAIARSLWGASLPDAAINYVWDNKYPIGTLRANAYTDRAQILVLESGAGRAGRWVNERRDVSSDLHRAFGDLPARLSGLAIASDTDNTGESARAGFADFHFVARDAACAFP
ncbi:DUF3047 domain-containing protein [Accumulibacter sp.]|uniref:DUF3047 domain-containing protein n=1 Tax=Accumulibacter sp. TaxID=2053492 RepID=UPI0025D246B0|nr:DUF3047 domain-containing protein [Accumulibacter sp.]MCM8611357.1 DUF3047 domain-containing protein [Accumulibacter sp.]MCM8634996.1 DUF3047 domain-containing protein [Accumulibacter sp.]MCM8639784.1 DUF3047 domain-containing protein [Accumulibacter sp.]